MAAARSAVVVGAGTGGLAAAGALARTGWRVTLLERAERLRAEPTALLLWPSGVAALQALGLGSGLDGVGTSVPDRGVRRPDGQWLVQPRDDPAPDGGATAGRRDRAGPAVWPPPLLTHAGDLHDALVASLGDQLEIVTGVRVRRAAAADRPAVTDGRATWEADLVVAADGLDSALRAGVARGTGVVSAGATTWRAVIPWYRAPQLPPDLATGGHTFGGGYQFFSAPLGGRGGPGAAGRGGAGGARGGAGGSGRGGRFWRATVTGAPRPEPPATQLQLLRRWFDGWHPPVGELLAATEPGDLVQRELRMVRPAPDRYQVPVGAGALVLLGDAGHGMAEHLGQGACLALEDAATLVATVREATPGGPLHAAAAAYDATRRRRVAEVARRSGRLGGTGALARRGAVLARRRDRAAAAATRWQPPLG